MKNRRLLTAITLGLGLALALGLLASISWAASPARPQWWPGNPVVNPTGNTHTASPTTTISITYDEPISPATVALQTFALHARQTGLLMGAYGVDGGTVSLTPTPPLRPGELVQVSATTDILSLLDGNGPLSPTVWEFRAAVGGGSGLFDDSSQRLASSYGVEVELGDLDGDGDLDAFVANGGGQANRVWLNDGTGTFHDSGQRLSGPWNHGVALGDLDGDGDLDAFVVNTTNQANRVWLNDGTGTFHDSGQRLGSSRSNGVALGDLDGDGDLDAFVANYNFYDGQPNRVWLNDGSGSFHASGQYLGNSSSYAVVVGDLDGDGDLDAFVANSHYQANRVWLNDGTGTFYDNGQRLGNSISWSVALGDVDGDGDLDAFVGNSYGQANRVWLNNGSGTFRDSGQRLGNSYSNGVELGDLDGDGDLDAFVANWNGQANRVWLNDGAGRFHGSGQGLGRSASHNVALGDVDGDGDLDAFTANGPGQADRVWLNQNRVDLSLTKTVTPTTAAPGQAITYTLVYTNYGPQVATDAFIADTDITLDNVSYTYTGAAITPTGSISYIWQVADLEPGEGGVITITGVSDRALPAGVLANAAAIFVDNPFDPDTDNNVGSATIALVPMADLSISKDSVRDQEAAIITYTITVNNLGPSDANGAIVADPIPAGIISFTWVCTSSGGATCTAGGSGSIYDTLCAFPVGGGAIYTVIATLPDSDTTVVNTATVAAPPGVTDPFTTTNNSATDISTPGEDIYLPFILRGG
jgi:uncharacterized repeat protein (TIGR01451 family)